MTGKPTVVIGRQAQQDQDRHTLPLLPICKEAVRVRLEIIHHVSTLEAPKRACLHLKIERESGVDEFASEIFDRMKGTVDAVIERSARRDVEPCSASQCMNIGELERLLHVLRCNHAPPTTRPNIPKVAWYNWSGKPVSPGGIRMVAMPRSLKEMPPYISEEDLAKELLGERAKEWRALAKQLERDEGFPAIDPLFGRRYWPLVRAWLDRRYGVPSKHNPPEESSSSSRARHRRGFGRKYG